MSSAPSQLLALRTVFALNALGLAIWFPRIPDVKADLGLDVLTLAFCLFGLPAGTIVGFVFVNRVTAAIGLRAACLWGGSIFLAAFIGPGLAGNALQLGLTLFLCGLSIAVIEVAMNAKAGQMEGAIGRRIMTGCHAYWSFGTVGGALLGGAFAQAGIGFLTQQVILQPIFIAGTVYAALRLLPDAPGETGTGADPGYAMPSRALMLICLVPISALLIEGAMMEWSALFLREDVGATPFATAAIFAVFAMSMGLSRLFGDQLAELAGSERVIVASGLVMGAGIGLFGLSTSLWISGPAAALVGAGCGNIYPLTMSMVARMPGRRSEKNVATLAIISFTAFLIGPPLIGSVASLTGLSTALAILAPLGFVPVVLILALRPEPRLAGR